MRKITLNALLALAVGFGSGCDNKGGNDNGSTTTEEIGSIEGDEISIDAIDDAARTADSAEISTGAPATYVYVSDAAFVSRAASSGMLEAELGQVAAQKGTAAEVKEFGQQMVTDHTNANNELKTLAGKKNWTIPAQMEAEHQATYDRIANLSGKDFDREYIAQMVSDHEMAVAMFKQANQKGTDTDLKAFASKTLPTLRKHLDMARDHHNTFQSK